MKESVIATVVQAVQFNHLDIVQYYIENNLIASSGVDENGCTLLHWAAINNRIPIASYLLNAGANINQTGGTLSETPLHWATRRELMPMINFLVMNGADLSIKSSNGSDALRLACEIGKGSISSSLISVINFCLGNINIIFLLLSRGANPNTVDNNGDTSLHWILKNHHDSTNTIRLLLRFGADLCLADSDQGDNAYHICAKTGDSCNVYVLYLLHKVGGGTAMTRTNRRGLTPLQVRH